MPHLFSSILSADHYGQTVQFVFHLTREHSSKSLVITCKILSDFVFLNDLFPCATAFHAMEMYDLLSGGCTYLVCDASNSYTGSLVVVLVLS